MAANTNFFPATQERQHQTQYPHVATDNQKQDLIKHERKDEKVKNSSQGKSPQPGSAASLGHDCIPTWGAAQP